MLKPKGAYRGDRKSKEDAHADLEDYVNIYEDVCSAALQEKRWRMGHYLETSQTGDVYGWSFD